MSSIAASRFAAAVALVLSLLTPAVLAASSPSEAAVVAHLYRDFGWQAFASQPDLFGEDITHQDRATLEKYFVPEVAVLLLRDAACQKHFQGVCNVESDLLFDSQDPVVTDLEVTRTGPGRVSVQFKDPLRRTTTQIEFQLVPVAGQWKISDITYRTSGGGSLRRLLSHKIR